jgi:uncharacterized protein (TIRG00374 family)
MLTKSLLKHPDVSKLTKMQKKKVLLYRKILALLLAITPIVLIFSQISLDEMRATLQKSAWWLLPMILASSFSAFFLQALRWAFLLRAFDPSLRFRRIISVHFKALYYSMILPTSAAQDIVRTLMISQQTHYAISWGAAWICRLIGLAMLLIFSFYGFFSLSDTALSPRLSPVFIFSVVTVLTAIFFSFSKAFTGLFRPFLGKIVPPNFFGAILNIRDAIFRFRHKRKAVLASALMTLCLYALVIFTPSLLLKGIAGRFYFIECLAFIPIIEVITMAAPLTPNGIGIREGLNALMLNYIGLSDEQIGLYVFFLLFTAFLKIVGGAPLLFGFLKKISAKNKCKKRTAKKDLYEEKTLPLLIR